MIKINRFIVGITPVVLASAFANCSNDEDDCSYKLGFAETTATIEGDNGSGLKSYFYEENGAYKCSWSVRDTYLFCDAADTFLYTNAGKSALNKFDFITRADRNTPAVGEGDVYYAFYPKGECKKYNGNGVFQVELPATQTYVKDSLANKYYPMVSTKGWYEGIENGFTLKFKNLASIVCIKVKTTQNKNKVMSITLTADQPLSGIGTATMALGGTPSLVMNEGASKSVTLDCGTGVEVNSSDFTTFFIVVPYGEYTNFKATVNCKVDADSNGNKYFEKSWDSYDLARSGINTYSKTTLLGEVFVEGGGQGEQGDSGN